MTVEWPVVYLTSDGSLPTAIANMAASGRAYVEDMAVSFLRQWVGLSLGTNDVYLRPTARPVARENLLATVWGALSCFTCGSFCRCEHVYTLSVPGPVVDGTMVVTIDGAVLDPSAYRVDNANLLTRQDGNAWPVYENVRTVDGDPGSWSISYTMGTEVPSGGQVAAGVLAEELAKMLSNDPSCQLPKRLQQVQRQGVTLETLYDNFSSLGQGLTGIWAVDQWVTSMTQGTATRRPKVYSPDVRSARRSGPPTQNGNAIFGGTL